MVTAPEQSALVLTNFLTACVGMDRDSSNTGLRSSHWRTFSRHFVD